MARSAPGQGGHRARTALGWLAWVGLLLVVAFGGGVLGRGVLAPPAFGDPGSWAGWVQGRAPLEAAFAVAALVAVVLAWYLLAVTSLAVAARLWGARRLASVVELLTLPVVRHGLHAALGVGLVGTSVAGGAAAVLDRPAPAVEIAAVPLAAIAVAEPEEASDAVDDEADPPVMRLLPSEPPEEVEAPPVTPTSPTGEATGSEWKVGPGDHLWSVAERVLEEAGAPGDDADVARYWLHLIEANLERLADPANPDLIFPGQVLALPSLWSPAEAALP